MHGQIGKAIIINMHCSTVDSCMTDITGIYFDKGFDYFSVKYIN